MNGSFEEADFTGWTVTNIDNVTEELNIYDRDTDCFDGVQSLMEPPIKNSSQYGDQYATVQIQVPRRLSEEAKQKLKEYASAGEDKLWLQKSHSHDVDFWSAFYSGHRCVIC